MLPMNYRLQFLMRDERHDFEIAVREPDWLRVAEEFMAERKDTSFIAVRTIDGRCVVLNLSQVQAMRHLYDPVLAAPDTTVHEGPILIQLIGREGPLEEFTSSDESLADLVMELEHGPGIVPVVKLRDEDGEWLRVDARQVVYVMVSSDIQN